MELSEAVLEIVRTAQHGTSAQPGWVTAYQVLNRLPEPMRLELVREHGGYGGRGHDADRGTGAANAVMRVLKGHPNQIEISFLDAWHDSKFAVGEENWIQPGNVTCALYRWRGASE